MTFVTPLWESDSLAARISRALLAPASTLYATAVVARNALYQAGWLKRHQPQIPVISVGNLSVGGTGKTPLSAWISSELSRRGTTPAIVMRGYGGGDESQVHSMLNPTIPVVVNPDRVAGVREAWQRGATVAVLDDGFQHLRLQRLVDVVLVSADRWREPLRVLPAGPWREGLTGFSRATFVVVTRKAVDGRAARELLTRLLPLTAAKKGAVAVLELGDVRNAATAEIRALGGLRGAKVLVVAGIGDPASLEAQLRSAGLDATMRVFPDHHAYTAADINRLARDASVFDYVFCTLKDAVKLGPLWPRNGPPLWYVSLRCRIESGEPEVSAILDQMAAASSRHISGAAGVGAPQTP